MSERKHTPGPWRIGTPGPNGCYTIGTERGLMTAMIAHSICEPDQAEAAKADAALVAAAPDLLRALELVMEDKAPGYHDCIDDGEPECAWCIARKAIAKATS